MIGFVKLVSCDWNENDIPKAHRFDFFFFSPFRLRTCENVMQCNKKKRNNRVTCVICHHSASFEHFSYKLCWLLNAVALLFFAHSFHQYRLGEMRSVENLPLIPSMKFAFLYRRYSIGVPVAMTSEISREKMFMLFAVQYLFSKLYFFLWKNIASVYSPRFVSNKKQ